MCCHLQILRIHLSSDEDLFFLHTLEVSEEEFQSLKIEQGILVDFGNFPGKVITLLQRCILAQTEDPPRYATADTSTAGTECCLLTAVALQISSSIISHRL